MIRLYFILVIFAFYGKFLIRMAMSPYSTHDVHMDLFIGFVSGMESRLIDLSMWVCFNLQRARWQIPIWGQLASQQNFNGHNIGIQIKQNELTKTFMTMSNCIKPFGLHGLHTNISVLWRLMMVASIFNLIKLKFSGNIPSRNHTFRFITWI